jgi:hypothetical protein
MNRIRPHMPGFMDFEPDPAADFDTLDALRAVPFVRRWIEDPQFRRLSISGPHGAEHLLMAEMADGNYWVVGYMQQPAPLPRWVAPQPTPGPITGDTP